MAFYQLTARLPLYSMVRETSSASDFVELKGTPGGVAQRYPLNSMFCMASISPVVEQAADTSRIALLEIRKRNDWAAFEELKKLVKELITESYSNAVLMRAISMWPVIETSIETFKRAVTETFDGDARMSDQYGTLLAGAWCLKHDRQPTEKEAADMVALFDWTEAQEINADTDAEQLLRKLMQQRVKIKIVDGDKDQYGGVYINSRDFDTTVGIMVAQLFGRHPDEGRNLCSDEKLAQELRKMGLWVKENVKERLGEKVLLVSNKSTWLKEVFAGTQSPVNWNNVLQHLSPQCFKPETGYRFNPVGKSERCLAIPECVLFSEGESFAAEDKQKDGVPTPANSNYLLEPNVLN